MRCPIFISLKRKAIMCGKSLCRNGFLLIIVAKSYLQRFYILNCFFSRNACNQKEGAPRTPTGIRLTSLGHWHIHSMSQTHCCILDLLQLKDYCAEPLQCICTAKHHGQTPIHFTNQLLVFLFHRKHSDSTSFQTLPSSNLSNCP